METADPCTTCLRKLEDHLEAGYGEFGFPRFETRAGELLVEVHAICSDRGSRIATILADRSLKRLETAKAVEMLCDPVILGDESDRLAMKALGYAAKFSLADPASGLERNRELRRRSLAVAERLGDDLARAVILTNWLFAEIVDGRIAEAEQLRREAGGFIEADAFAVATAKARELKGRYLTHCAKLALHVASGDVLAQVESLYARAVELVVAEDHQRVNFQIEYADTLAGAAASVETMSLGPARAALEVAHRAQATHICDECRAYFHATAASIHELAAERAYNVDKAEAIREWSAAIAERGRAVDAFTAAKHHLAGSERDKLAEQRQTLARVMQPQKIFLSHKTADKPFVEAVFVALRELGFDPWYDDDAMPAAAAKSRALVEGMEQSCAAVFFVTAIFKDNKFIEREIDYALEAQEANPAFKLIPLDLTGDGDGRNIPGTLKRFVHKHVTSELDALRAILEALPIRVGTVRWKEPDE